MGTKNYITAIEIGSSKVAGVIGLETYEGIKIIAYACEPVEGFISKGVVRNVDATSACLTNIINRLETQLDNKINIEKAYINIAGLSVHSIKSTIKREFDEYKKITPEIIDELALDNENQFVVPEGYQKVQVIVQEYKLDGAINTAPTGFHTRCIECSYLNIVIKEQFMKQLCESFEMAKIVIADSFCAAKIDADNLLNKDDKRNCALVNMGAETTTISIYRDELLRKLVVIPLGGENITKDICAEQVSREEAEQLKIFKGYNSTIPDNSTISNEVLNKIIAARVEEILQNIKHQIITSGEKVTQILFTGGAARLKNLAQLIKEQLPTFSTRIIVEPSLNSFSDRSLYLAEGAITPTLFGLLSTGKENCCRETMPKEPVKPVQIELFPAEEPQEEPGKVAEPEKKEPKKESKTPKNPKSTGGGLFVNFFGQFINKGKEALEDLKTNITETEGESDDE